MSLPAIAEALRDHCLSKPGAWPDSPWGDHEVAKVGDKIFAFLGDDTLGVKAARTREEADEWCAEFPDDASRMAYIGRHGWNTLRLGGAIDLDRLREAADTSYDLVVESLPASRRPASA